MKMDFSHDRMVIEHSIVVSIVGIDHEIGVSIAKLSMLTSDFAIDTTIEWSITILS